MVQNSKKRVRINTSNLENSTYSSNNTLPSLIISSSPNMKDSNITQTPVIQVEDVLSEKVELSYLTCIIKEMQLQIDELKTKLSSLECIPETISHMKKELQDPTILKLFNMTSRMTHTDSKSTIELENAIDFLSSEVVKRLASKQNAKMYNVSDSEPIKSVHHSLLKAANLLSAPCQCIRLSIKDLKHPCPILFRFDSYIIAERFKMAEDLLATATKFKTIKVISDKTPNQKQAKLTTLRNTSGMSAEVSMDTEAQLVTCIALGE
uniref:Uncharacterized protein n=1 Tax=Trichobilharzia regenti TaxID=157069 RepID=A0AA85JB90_TRIRE|nr:unnamed protein product [Trichobilharzia regenti]